MTLPDGEGVHVASVFATLLEPESRAYSVGVFTGESGDFEIRGLAPGDYQLLVRVPTGDGHWVLVRPFNPALDLRQTLRAGSVRVRAGEESGPVPLAVRRRQDNPFR